MQAEQRSERELFQAYLKECDECCIVPDVGGAFHAGYSAALSHPSPQGWQPRAWMRKWAYDGEVPQKERKANGRLAWPFRFKLLPITSTQILDDDVPLFPPPPEQGSKG